MLGNLYATRIPISQGIEIVVPTVGTILENQEEYFDIIYTIISTPYDMMVQLDDAGIDFTSINDFDLFCLLFGKLKKMDTSLVFGELDISGFQHAVSDGTGEVVLIDEETNITIDRIVHNSMCEAIRDMLKLEKNNKRPANEEAKIYELKKARKKIERLKKNRDKKRGLSQLEKHIVSLVNTSEFPYDYESVRGLTIMQFYASLSQVIKKVKYDKTMVGYFAGTVDLDSLPIAERTWVQTD